MDDPVSLFSAFPREASSDSTSTFPSTLRYWGLLGQGTIVWGTSMKFMLGFRLWPVIIPGGALDMASFETPFGGDLEILSLEEVFGGVPSLECG